MQPNPRTMAWAAAAALLLSPLTTPDAFAGDRCRHERSRHHRQCKDDGAKAGVRIIFGADFKRGCRRRHQPPVCRPWVYRPPVCRPKPCYRLRPPVCKPKPCYRPRPVEICRGHWKKRLVSPRYLRNCERNGGVFRRGYYQRVWVPCDKSHCKRCSRRRH